MAGAMAGSAILDLHGLSDSLKLVTLTVNNTCNLTCPHCYLQYNAGDGFVSDDTIHRVLTSNCERIAIVGKEPLSNRETARRTWGIVQESVSRGKRISLITNGMGLDYLPDNIVDMVEFIDVSFDGGPATYQSYRGASYQKLSARIKRFAQAGFGRFRALSVLSNATIGALDDLLSVTDIPGIERLILSPFLPTKNNGSNSVTPLSLDELFGGLLKSSKFLKSENVVVLLAQHECGLLGWDPNELAMWLRHDRLRSRIHYVGLDPLDLGIIRVTYDGYVMSPLASLHPAEYASVGLRLDSTEMPLDALYAQLQYDEDRAELVHAH